VAHHSPPDNPFVRYPRLIGQWLTAPSSHIQEPEQRRQAQLLSLLHVLLFAFGISAGVIAYWSELKASLQDQVVTATGLGLVGLAYITGRTRYYMASAVFTVAVLTLSVFILAIPGGDVYRANMLIYLVIPVLLSSMFLSFRATAILITLQTVGMVAYHLYFDTTGSDNWTAFVMVTSIMVLLGSRFLIQRERARQTRLLKTENRYRTFVENVPLGVYRTSPDARGEFLMANPAFVSLLGFASEDDLKKVKESDIYADPADRQRFMGTLLAQGNISDVEVRLKRKDGTPIWGSVTARVVQDEDGRTLYCDCTVKDITERKRIEETLYYIAQRSWALTGQAFFDSLVQHLAASLGVDYAFVGELTEGGVRKLRTTALYARGALAEPVEYNLEYSPCETVIGNQLRYYEGTQALFPQDQMLLDLAVESYMGMPLWDAEGQPLGVTVIMNRSPLADIPLAGSLLQIVSVRAAHELARRRAEKQLRESEARYRAVVEDQTELVVRWKPDGTRTFVNDAYCRYFAHPPEQLIGTNFLSLVVEDERQAALDTTADLTPDTPVKTGMLRNLKPDGGIAWLEWTRRGIFDEDGRLIEIQSVGHDVTERIQMAEQVRQERDRAQLYLDIAGVILVALNERGEITLINRKGREILGYTEEELIGHNWFEIALPADEKDQVRQVFRALMAGEIESLDRYENAVVSQSGEKRLIAWNNTLLFDAEGHIVGTLSSGEDITERKLAEDALRGQRALAEALRDIAALINSTLDPERVFDRILMNLGRVVPYDLAVIMTVEHGAAHIVRSRSDIHHPVDEETLRARVFSLDDLATLRQMVKTGQPCIVRDTRAYPDWADLEETRWVRSYVGAPIRVSGEIIGFINITSAQPNFFTDEQVERLQAFADQAAIAINNASSYDDLERRVIDRTVDLSVRNAVAETLSNTLEMAPMLNGVLHTTVERLGVLGGAIYLLSDNGSTLNLIAHYGTSAETLQRVTGIVPGGTDLGVIGNALNMLSDSAPDIPRETGIFAVLSVPIWRQGQVQGVITLVHDQPRPWRAEETRMLDAIGRQIGVALVNARLYADAVRDEAHIRTILQSVADGLLVFDQNNTLTLMNPAAEALFSFYPLTSGGAEKAAALLWLWLQSQPNLPEGPVEFSLPLVPVAQIDRPKVQGQCPLVHHEDELERAPDWPCWLFPNISPEKDVRQCPIYERIPRCVLQAHSAAVRDADGQVLGTVIVLHDVTYFRELDDLKGRFVSTVSHELRTPLSVVLLQVSTLIKYYDRLPDGQRREMVNEIQQQAHILRELIEDILELSRFDAKRSMPQKQWFDLAGHCEELVSLLQPSISEKHLRLNFVQNLESSYVRADPQQVMRVLRNLVSNAIKYTPEGGQITLEVERVDGEVRLAVSDTGIGIAPEEQLYIFDRFYRSEQAARMASGTGLGLSITKEIVDLHGGRIELESAPGQGSTFTIYLPVFDDR
jgi:PAS domain S-box-containing protein